ncbi:MAG: hypothetical protein PHT12_06660 [Patescibacteria group bacterium]|nr:hypothetical protein [Patescibacteria group bacterium]
MPTGTTTSSILHPFPLTIGVIVSTAGLVISYFVARYAESHELWALLQGGKIGIDVMTTLLTVCSVALWLVLTGQTKPAAPPVAPTRHGPKSPAVAAPATPCLSAELTGAAAWALAFALVFTEIVPIWRDTKGTVAIVVGLLFMVLGTAAGWFKSTGFRNVAYGIVIAIVAWSILKIAYPNVASAIGGLGDTAVDKATTSVRKINDQWRSGAGNNVARLPPPARSAARPAAAPPAPSASAPRRANRETCPPGREDPYDIFLHPERYR